MTATQSWLLNWFLENGDVPGGLSTEDLLNSNYFDLGVIDSFAVIGLVEDIENFHRIKFDGVAFQDRRFGMIATLAEMIDEARLAG